MHQHLGAGLSAAIFSLPLELGKLAGLRVRDNADVERVLGLVRSVPVFNLLWPQIVLWFSRRFLLAKQTLVWKPCLRKTRLLLYHALGGKLSE